MATKTVYRCEKCNKMKSAVRRSTFLHECSRCERKVCGECRLMAGFCVDCVTDEDRAEWRTDRETALEERISAFVKDYGPEAVLMILTRVTSECPGEAGR